LSKVGSSNIDRGSLTQVIEVVINPCLCSLPPQCAKLPEEPDIGVEFARGPEPTHYIIGANGMNEDALCVALAQFSIVNQFCHESDRSHFPH
jgi:hypothetical protein